MVRQGQQCAHMQQMLLPQAPIQNQYSVNVGGKLEIGVKYMAYTLETIV